MVTIYACRSSVNGRKNVPVAKGTVPASLTFPVMIRPCIAKSGRVSEPIIMLSATIVTFPPFPKPVNPGFIPAKRWIPSCSVNLFEKSVFPVFSTKINTSPLASMWPGPRFAKNFAKRSYWFAAVMVLAMGTVPVGELTNPVAVS